MIGSTITWVIDEFDAVERTTTYSVNVCDCGNIGTLETLAGVTYADAGATAAGYPVLPSSLPVEVTDNTELCGTPSVGLGELNHNHPRGFAKLDSTACLLILWRRNFVSRLGKRAHAPG